jgi:hypothetical protein
MEERQVAGIKKRTLNGQNEGAFQTDGNWADSVEKLSLAVALIV